VKIVKKSLRASNWKIAAAYARNPNWDKPQVPLLPAAETEIEDDGDDVECEYFEPPQKTSKDEFNPRHRKVEKL
jgi:hypothetical protein